MMLMDSVWHIVIANVNLVRQDDFLMDLCGLQDLHTGVGGLRGGSHCRMLYGGFAMIAVCGFNDYTTSS